MEIYANELSISEKTFDKYDNIKNLAQAYKLLRDHGFSSCRINNEALGIMYAVLTADPQKRNLLNFVFSFFHAPFDYEGNADALEDEYLSHSWSCDGKECIGLAYAKIMDSLALSFEEGKWGPFVFINRDSEKIEIKNVSKQEHVLEHSVWIDSQKQVVLIETDIPFEKKDIHLRDDHGKDVLDLFSKRICKSPYVIGVINSLPFNPKEKNFIRSCSEDGLIECVLRWTDEGFGIVIQSTGRNMRETETIAEILEKKFCE